MTVTPLRPVDPDAPLEGFAYAGGPPAAAGRLRATPEDFQVEELLDEEPEGRGEHVWIKVRKRGANTEWVARQLRGAAGARPVDVAYAGLKDRHAVCVQWFSVRLPKGPEPDWRALGGDEFQVLEVVRHPRKLRRGALAGNHFQLVIRDLAGEPATLDADLARVAREGVPNYFGEQRFGRHANNLVQADRLFAGHAGRLPRHQRGLYLSAARSWLFNQVLSQRVRERTWNHGLDGEAFMLEGTRSIFRTSVMDDALRRRVDEFDIHPTGPLWGSGPTPAQGEVERLETRVLASYESWRVGLEREGVIHQRRALRLPVLDLEWTVTDRDTLTLTFQLAPGAFATAVTRELIAAPVG